MAFDEEEDLGDGEETHNGDKEVDPVEEMQVAAGQTRQAGGAVHADHRDAKPEAGRQSGLGLIVRGHAAQRAEGQQVEREILGGTEEIGHARQHRRQQHQSHCGQKRADERGDTGEHQRIPGPALLGHRIAVERGHQRRFVPWDIEQDG